MENNDIVQGAVGKQLKTVEEETNEKVLETPTEEAPAEEDEKITQETIDNLRNVMKNLDMMIQVVQGQWEADIREYHPTTEQINQLIKWNSDHRISDEDWKKLEDEHVADILAKMDKVQHAEIVTNEHGETLPNMMIKEGEQLIDTGISVEEANKLPTNMDDVKPEEYDPLNGLQSITEEFAEEIFGDGHAIIGVSHEITLSRISDMMHDWFTLASVKRDYKQCYDSYIHLSEELEDENMNELLKNIEEETDPEVKVKKQAAYDKYFNFKYLGFLAEPLNEATINRITSTLSKSEKAEYLIKRTRDRLHQIHASSKFILEISQFEKRFMEEKYWKCNQSLLAYFMNTLVYSNPSVKNDENRTKAVNMIFALDAIVQHTWSDDRIEKVMNNLRLFYDQLVDKVPTTDSTINISE